MNTRPRTIKLLEENLGEELLDVSVDYDVLDLKPNGRATKAKIGKWDYIKLRSHFTTKETVYKSEREPTEWEKKWQVLVFLIRG